MWYVNARIGKEMRTENEKCNLTCPLPSSSSQSWCRLAFEDILVWTWFFHTSSCCPNWLFCQVLGSLYPAGGALRLPTISVANWKTSQSHLAMEDLSIRLPRKDSWAKTTGKWRCYPKRSSCNIAILYSVLRKKQNWVCESFLKCTLNCCYIVRPLHKSILAAAAGNCKISFFRKQPK